MSRLEELIEKLCPEGVEYASIGSLIKRIKEKGKDYTDIDIVYSVSNKEGIVKSSEYRENEIHSEDTSNYTVIREGMFAYNPSRLNIGSIAWLKTDECGLVSPMYIVFDIDRNRIKEEFLMELIRTDKIKNKIDSLKESGARFRFDFERWNWIKIPLPPVEIQDEIIKILNKFKELTTELTARKKQYEHYRDELLTLGEKPHTVKLDSICKIGDGLHSTPKYSNDGPYYFINGNNLNDGSITFDEKTKKVNKEEYEKYKVDFDNNTIFMSINGTIGKMAFYNNEPIILGKSAAYFIVNATYLNKKYLFYYLQSNKAKQYFLASLTGSTILNLGLKALRNFEIPLPSLEEQQRIVDILDRFDRLCNDISEGLPAEIEARQKQYEYYRDKLLTFKEKAI